MITLLLAATIVFGPGIYARMTAPATRSDLGRCPQGPDYTQRSNWSAWPGPGSPAERLPDGMTPTPPDSRLASAFFLHPTTFGGTETGCSQWTTKKPVAELIAGRYRFRRQHSMIAVVFTHLVTDNLSSANITARISSAKFKTSDTRTRAQLLSFSGRDRARGAHHYGESQPGYVPPGPIDRRRS
ncbi:MAG: hypothetical protein CM15mP84_01130 [Cellvibrionales bacterium]|nr:MAG: hypothetical protein CM15mP84_01130 [Cellvibrionales bacterium]